MTVKERNKIRKAINLLADDDWDGGMAILFKLIGREYPFASDEQQKQ